MKATRLLLACALGAALSLSGNAATAQPADIAGTLPPGKAPQPQRPDDLTPPAVDSAHANVTSPVSVPRVRAVAELSPALTHAGAPVDPLCFIQTWEQPADGAVIDLTQCRTGAYNPVADKSYKPGVGVYGTAYRPAGTGPESGATAYIEYRYLGDTGGRSAILLSESGDGSGMFSSLMLLRRDGDRLLVDETAAAGDRCNGGIPAATVTDGVLRYDVNLTPAALYALTRSGEAADAPAPLKDCAVCCYATATYKGGQLQNVTLVPNLAAALAPGEEGAMGCFDAQIDGQIKAGRTILSPAHMKTLGDAVYNSCLAHATHQ